MLEGGGHLVINSLKKEKKPKGFNPETIGDIELDWGNHSLLNSLPKIKKSL